MALENRVDFPKINRNIKYNIIIQNLQLHVLLLLTRQLIIWAWWLMCEATAIIGGHIIIFKSIKNVSHNTWMRWEEIANCKSHIASVILTDWCIMIFYFFLNNMSVNKDNWWKMTFSWYSLHPWLWTEWIPHWDSNPGCQHNKWMTSSVKQNY